MNGKTLFESSSLSGSQTIKLTSTGTLKTSGYISYSNQNPNSFLDEIEVLPIGTSGATKWSFNEGNLVFSGNGLMEDYSSNTNTPWYYLRDQIQTITIGDGIQNIGKNAFEFVGHLSTVQLPTTLIIIEQGAFSFCEDLTEVTIPENVRKIEDYAFENCKSLTTVTIPEGVLEIGVYAFYNTPVTLNVYPGSVAHQYALDNNIPFVLLPGVRFPGDVTGDGKINLSDVVRLLKYVSGWDVEIVEENSDVTGDGKITLSDVVRLLKYVSNWDVVLQ